MFELDRCSKPNQKQWQTKETRSQEQKVLSEISLLACEEHVWLGSQTVQFSEMADLYCEPGLGGHIPYTIL